MILEFLNLEVWECSSSYFVFLKIVLILSLSEFSFLIFFCLNILIYIVLSDPDLFRHLHRNFD